MKTRFKKMLSLALAMLFTLSAVPFAALSAGAAKAGVKPGDADLNGSVTAADALQILRCAVGFITPAGISGRSPGACRQRPGGPA